MAALSADRPGLSRCARLLALAGQELAPFPGRMDTVWRYLLVSALVITLSMALQVPVLGLSLVIVFFAAQENTVLTLVTCVLSVIGTTAAIGLAFLLVKYTMGYPMLRIGGGFALLFGAIYFMRISRLGQLSWIAAMAISYTLTMLDGISDPEFMTRFLLWVWVATVYPILVTALVNQLLLPAHPDRLLTDELLRQLEEVDQQLEARRTRGPIPVMSLDGIERGVQSLHRHLAFAVLGNPDYKRERGLHLIRINTVDRLRTAAVRLARLPAEGPEPEQRVWIGRLQGACRDLREAIVARRPFTVDPALVGEVVAEQRVDVALQEMGHALNALAQAESLPHPTGVQAKGRMIAEDWLSNPVYGRFALKTALAGFICYVFLGATQWPGIHTAVLTCFIVALPSLGAISRKGLLRIVGCALGSLVTLAITVFLIPHLDTLTGLLLLTLPIIAVGAWIAAGSERSSYIGLQFVFAFSLAMFSQFAPNTNIPEIRDRMLGIMLGVTVSILVHVLLWPEREGSELWSQLARLVRSIAGLARVGRSSGDALPGGGLDGARQQGWATLAANREMESRVALEPGWQYAHDAVTVDLQTWFAQAQETLFSVNWLQTLLQHGEPALPAALLRSCEQFREEAARCLDQLAEHLDRHAPDHEPVSLAVSLAALDRHLAQARGAGAAARRIDEIGAAVHALNERIAQLGNHFSAAAQQTAGTR